MLWYVSRQNRLRRQPGGLGSYFFGGLGSYFWVVSRLMSPCKAKIPQKGNEEAKGISREGCQKSGSHHLSFNYHLLEGYPPFITSLGVFIFFLINGRFAVSTSNLKNQGNGPSAHRTAGGKKHAKMAFSWFLCFSKEVLLRLF